MTSQSSTTAAAADGDRSARPPAVTLRGLTKVFGSGGTEVVAVDNVDLEVVDGEFLTLLGPSGSGKTTVLRMIAGFEISTSGTIRLGGADAPIPYNPVLEKAAVPQEDDIVTAAAGTGIGFAVAKRAAEEGDEDGEEGVVHRPAPRLSGSKMAKRP